MKKIQNHFTREGSKYSEVIEIFYDDKLIINSLGICNLSGNGQVSLVQNEYSLFFEKRRNGFSVYFKKKTETLSYVVIDDNDVITSEASYNNETGILSLRGNGVSVELIFDWNIIHLTVQVKIVEK